MAPMAAELVLTGARVVGAHAAVPRSGAQVDPRAGALVDILVRDGRIAAVAADLSGDLPAHVARLDLPGRWAELHIMLGEAVERGRGVGRQAVAELMARGFALGLERIELKVLESNLAARRVYEACGFRVVGRDEPVVKGGRRVDVLLMRADQPRSATVTTMWLSLR